MQLKSKLITNPSIRLGGAILLMWQGKHMYKARRIMTYLGFATNECMSIATKRIAIDKGVQDFDK